MEHVVYLDTHAGEKDLQAQLIPAAQIVCLSAPALSSKQIWQTDSERGEMKTLIHQLPQPEEMWPKFLAFDALITATILQKSRASGIPICARDKTETVEAFATRVRQALGIP
jgi:hypothetical protein